MSSKKAFYTTVQLPDENDCIVLRIRPDGKVEVLYEQKRGPISLLRWDSGWVPDGHSLAKFSVDDAIAYVNFENNMETSDGH